MLNKEKPVKVTVNKEKCTKCGICTDICYDYLEKSDDGYPVARPLEKSMMGCIQCGLCMMKCPTEAIEIIGEDIDKNHLRPIPNDLPDYNAIHSLMLKRRSIRKYTTDEISKETIEKIIDSAATAPVSIPPSEVKVIVIQGRKKVQEFTNDLLTEIKHLKKIMNPFALKIMGIFIGKKQYRLIKEFVLPLCDFILEAKEKGEDYLFYNAPVVFVFSGTDLTDKEDKIIAATHATIAAESLNLGTCFIGMVSPLINSSSKLRKKYGMQKGDSAGTAFILGVPDDKYLKTFQRSFKEVKTIN